MLSIDDVAERMLFHQTLDIGLNQLYNEMLAMRGAENYNTTS